MPQCYPHLTIDNQTIVQDLQESLQSAATTPKTTMNICKRSIIGHKLTVKTSTGYPFNGLSEDSNHLTRHAFKNFFMTGYLYVQQSICINQPLTHNALSAGSTKKTFGIYLSVNTPPNKPYSTNYNNSSNSYTNNSILPCTYSNFYGKDCP